MARKAALKPDGKKLIDMLKTAATEDGQADGVARIIRPGRYAEFNAVLLGRQTFTDRSVGSREEQLARLDAIGLNAVAENIAQGALPFECAKTYGVQAMVFREWWGSLPSHTVREALASFSEASMLKAELVLTSAPLSKEDAVVQVALADHFQKMAQATDPSRWNPGKAKPPDAPPAPILLSSSMPGLQNVLGSRVPQVEAAPPQPLSPAPKDVATRLRSRASAVDDGVYIG